MSAQGDTHGKRNTSSIQRPMMGGMQNNSMQHFNVQYQSDTEADLHKAKGLLGSIQPRTSAVLDSPMKKKLIPPLV